MKLKLQAQHLQVGDIVGSGEKVVHVSAGVRTPKGKVDIMLKNLNTEQGRWSQWGKYTMINVERDI